MSKENLRAFQFRPGQNPRKVLKNHSGRNTKKWKYDMPLISQLANVSIHQLRRAKAANKINPDDLLSVLEYVGWQVRRELLEELVDLRQKIAEATKEYLSQMALLRS